jgi:hypothetical protein
MDPPHPTVKYLGSYSIHTFTMSAAVLNLTPFEDAMNKAFEKMTQKERDELSALQTIDDVYAETDKIQMEQGQKGLLRNSTKIQPYLLWLQQFSGVIEVFVSIKPSLLALIWVSICNISSFHGFSGTNY